MSESIFTTQVPDHPDQNDGASYTLSSLFSASINGTISGIRWYFPATLPSGTVLGGLFAYIDDSTPGSLLGSANFVTPTAGTWNVATFSSSVPITAGTLYYASVQTNDHYVSVANGSWTTTTNGHLTLPADEGGIPQRNGRFFPFSGTTLTYPTGGNGQLYLVDVVFDSSAGVSFSDGAGSLRLMSSADAGSAAASVTDAAGNVRLLRAADASAAAVGAADTAGVLRLLRAADIASSAVAASDAAAALRLLRTADVLTAGATAADAAAAVRLLSSSDAWSTSGGGVSVADRPGFMRLLRSLDRVTARSTAIRPNAGTVTRPNAGLVIRP